MYSASGPRTTAAVTSRFGEQDCMYAFALLTVKGKLSNASLTSLKVQSLPGAVMTRALRNGRPLTRHVKTRATRISGGLPLRRSL